MAHIKNLLIAEIDPGKPVPELCSVIMAVVAFHSKQEENILNGIVEAINKRKLELKGVAADAKQLLQPSTNE
jgi:hypothetical protein